MQSPILMIQYSIAYRTKTWLETFSLEKTVIIQKVKKRSHEILAENTGKTVEEIEAATERDHYLSPSEAVDFGLIDKIVTTS